MPNLNRKSMEKLFSHCLHIHGNLKALNSNGDSTDDQGVQVQARERPDQEEVKPIKLYEAEGGQS